MIRWAMTALLSIALLTGCMSPKGDSVAEKRRTVQQMRSETLAELYKIHPIAKTRIKRAAGYGVFSNIGINLFLVSTATGWGVVRDKETGKDTYMKMASAGVGIGLGVKDFRGVFVFTSKEALRGFVEDGWDASAQADAAAKTDSKGGAWAGGVDVAPGIRLYQITKSGLALQATIQGTKFWKDDDLR
jgi:lipid-binding SYLF domain-containing protein